MSLLVLVSCDGTPADRPGMALERCRAFLPLPFTAPDDLAARSTAAGYRVVGDRHLCPTCARARLAVMHDQRWPWCDRHDQHTHTDRVDGPPLVDGEPAGPMLELEDRQVHP